MKISWHPRPTHLLRHAWVLNGGVQMSRKQRVCRRTFPGKSTREFIISSYFRVFPFYNHFPHTVFSEQKLLTFKLVKSEKIYSKFTPLLRQVCAMPSEQHVPRYIFIWILHGAIKNYGTKYIKQNPRRIQESELGLESNVRCFALIKR